MTDKLNPNAQGEATIARLRRQGLSDEQIGAHLKSELAVQEAEAARGKAAAALVNELALLIKSTPGANTAADVLAAGGKVAKRARAVVRLLEKHEPGGITL